MLRKWGTLVLLLLASPALAMAQNTGKLAGRVMDQGTGEPLPGATIALVGTQLGTVSDIDGNYFIIGVPVGQYDVQASFVGYTTETFTGVDITSGRTREINFSLSDDNVMMDGIEIVYERPLIQKDAIGVPKVVTGEEIANLPVRGIAGVAALQGGVVSSETSSALFIRGGRSEEVAYYVDGVRVVGSAAVPTQAIQEQEMLIGSIPARYGDAMSGVISVTTKGGTTPDFYGSIEGITSEVLDDYGYNTLSAVVGGPIVKDRAAFFISAEYADRGDAGPRALPFAQVSDDVFDSLQQNPQSVKIVSDDTGEFSYVQIPGSLSDSIRAGMVSPADLLPIIEAAVPEGFHLDDGAHPQPIFAPNAFTSDDLSDSNARPNNGLSSVTINGNLTFNPSSAIRIRVGGSFDEDHSNGFSFARSIYANDRFIKQDRQTYRVNGAWTHYISNNTFYQLQADYSNYEGENYWPGFGKGVENVPFYGDIDHPANATAARYIRYDEASEVYTMAYRDGNLPGGSDIQSTFAAPGATMPNYSKFRTEQFGFRASATTQLGLHQIEFGGEYQQRTQRSYNVSPDRWAVNHVDDACIIGVDADGNATVEAPDADFTGDCDPQSASQAYKDWGDLSYDLLRNSVSYFGYNPNGTEEADDESIDGLYGYNGDTNTNIAPYQPIYYAGYISDKLEYRDIVMQIGARVDVFDNNTRTLRDPYALVQIQRAGSLANRPANIGSDYAVYFVESDAVGYRDLDGNFFDANGESVAPSTIVQDLEGTVKIIEGSYVNEDGVTVNGPLNFITEEIFTDYEPQVNFQPRIGVSFPVTDRALFYASYDVVTQRPSEYRFTTIEGYRSALQGGRISNPALQPESTTQYELGFRQRLGERAAFQVSGFFRQIENKISRRIVQNVFPTNYQTYQNVDFGTVKGVEMEFDLRRTNNLQFNANYTLSFAQGTGADADAVSQITWRQESDPFYPNFISPLDFDQRHKVNITADYRLGEGEGPRVGSAYPLANLGVNLIATVGTGLPYTRRRDDSPLFTGFNGFLEGQINGESQPSTALLNLRVDRRFKLGSANLVAYLWVQNLLNSDNVQAVYPQTGLAETDGYLNGEQGLGRLAEISASQSPLESQSYADHYRLSANNPFRYGIPRQTRIGVRLDF